MNRKLTLYIVFLVIIVGLLILLDYNRPKPIDWTPSYSTNDKIPFGLYVLDKEAPVLFKGNEIEKFSVTPYEYFELKYDYDNSKYNIKGSFINIDGKNRIDNESAKELLLFAQHGNTVFLSMTEFPKLLMDTLKIEATNGFYYKDSIAFSCNKEKAGHKKHFFSEGISFSYFKSVDTLATTILGHQEIGTIKQANFIKVRYGNGNFILHTQPAAFTNFHLLKGDHYKYAEEVLSYLPQENIYWNTKNYLDGEESGSPLRYVLKQPGLKWSLYIALIGLVIFIIFNARRKQRIIPEISPLKNTTVDFTKTIGNLYYQEGNHHTIIEKKIIYFLEHIRTEYLIDTYSLDEEFVEKLHQKTGKPVEDIQKTVSLIKKYRHQFQSTEADVIEINNAIENLRL
jgi:hypothetical protein